MRLTLKFQESNSRSRDQIFCWLEAGGCVILPPVNKNKTSSEIQTILRLESWVMTSFDMTFVILKFQFLHSRLRAWFVFEKMFWVSERLLSDRQKNFVKLEPVMMGGDKQEVFQISFEMFVLNQWPVPKHQFEFFEMLWRNVLRNCRNEI